MQITHSKARNPFEIGLLVYCAVTGTGHATAQWTPLEKIRAFSQITGVWHWAWSAIFVGGALIALTGALMKDYTKGLFYERVGLFGLMMGSAAYLTAVVEVSNWRTSFGSYVFLSMITLVSAIRWFAIQRVIIRTKRAGRDGLHKQ